MLTCLFPGQGSQRRGMGAEWFDECADLEAIASDVLGYSLRELCLADPRNELNQTQFTQPALYVINAMAYRRRSSSGRPPPDVLMGHSLGEFNALLAAGVYDFGTGLRLVQQRGALMSRVRGGGMAAVMRVPEADLRMLLSDNGLSGIDLANFNAPDQIVISGMTEDIERAAKLLTERNKVVSVLNTSGAFHSRYMLAARQEFEGVLSKVQLSPPKIPVISNYSARPHGAADISFKLAAQLSSPVRWCEGIEYVLELGEMEFEEVGVGKVLSNLTTRIVSAWQARGRAAAAPSDSPGKSALPPVAAEEKVRRWNAKYPVGVQVRPQIMKGTLVRTSSEAHVLFGHRAAVYLEGYRGYFDLDEVVVAAEG